ncbi:MAG TPA: hypothetical protein VLV83_24865 [Acidobacteriota bacterium]|nr:hypothetical protein [Acidobacteriota bacterium]
MSTHTYTKARRALDRGEQCFRCSPDITPRLIRLWQQMQGEKVAKAIYVRPDLRGRNRLVVER